MVCGNTGIFTKPTFPTPNPACNIKICRAADGDLRNMCTRRGCSQCPGCVKFTKPTPFVTKPTQPTTVTTTTRPVVDKLCRRDADCGPGGKCKLFGFSNLFNKRGRCVGGGPLPTLPTKPTPNTGIFTKPTATTKTTLVTGGTPRTKPTGGLCPNPSAPCLATPCARPPPGCNYQGDRAKDACGCTVGCGKLVCATPTRPTRPTAPTGPTQQQTPLMTSTTTATTFGGGSQGTPAVCNQACKDLKAAKDQVLKQEEDLAALQERMKQMRNASDSKLAILQAQLAEALSNKVVKDLEEKIAALTEANKDDSEAKALQAALDAARIDHAAKFAELQDKNTRELERALALLRQEMGQGSQDAGLQAKIDALQAQLTKAQQQEQSADDLTDLYTLREALVAALAETRRGVAELQKNVGALPADSPDLPALKAKLAELQAQETEQSSELEWMLAQIATREGEQKQASETSEDGASVDLLTKLQQDMRTLQAENDALNKRLESDITSAQANLAVAQAKEAQAIKAEQASDKSGAKEEDDSSTGLIVGVVVTVLVLLVLIAAVVVLLVLHKKKEGKESLRSLSFANKDPTAAQTDGDLYSMTAPRTAAPAATFANPAFSPGGATESPYGGDSSIYTDPSGTFSVPYGEDDEGEDGAYSYCANEGNRASVKGNDANMYTVPYGDDAVYGGDAYTDIAPGNPEAFRSRTESVA